MELADFEKMEQIRARVDELVDDPEMAEALKPYYRQFCKRPCFHDEYLHTFNRANVTLVDTEGQGVERITEHGIVANGVEYEIDCLIYATGFEVGTDVQPPRRVRGLRARRPHADREVGGRRVDPARHAQRGFPNLLHRSASCSPGSP